MYNKPLILTNDDMAEGVYAASGNPASSGSSYSLSLRNADDWNGVKDYDITFINNTSNAMSSITVTVKVNGTVTSIGGNVTGVINGTTADVTFNNYGNGIEANGTYGNIWMKVTGTGDFSLE